MTARLSYTAFSWTCKWSVWRARVLRSVVKPTWMKVGCEHNSAGEARKWNVVTIVCWPGTQTVNAPHPLNSTQNRDMPSPAVPGLTSPRITRLLSRSTGHIPSARCRLSHKEARGLFAKLSRYCSTQDECSVVVQPAPLLISRRNSS